MNLRTLIASAALALSVGAHAESGTLTFSDFVHNADFNASTLYHGFSFGSAWFPNPSTEIRDPYLALSTNGGARSVFVERADHTPFNLDSFNYAGRSDTGLAYLVMYNGGTTVFSGTTDNNGKLQFKTLAPAPTGVPGGQTFSVAATSGYTGQITGFSFAFKAAGGGFGDGSDSLQFAFDTMKYSNATAAAALPPVTPAVPEPQTYALILAGLGVLVFKGRRQRRT
jgi:hypothetical protein